MMIEKYCKKCKKEIYQGYAVTMYEGKELCSCVKSVHGLIKCEICNKEYGFEKIHHCQ